jgi:phosphogluconate dehydratase
MELSLFSRDVIAMATAVALSHDVFDAALLLGVCDKIVPGLLIGALQLRPPALRLRARRADGHGPVERGEGPGAPAVRRGPGGPRRTAGGRVAAYHGAGTCTFYGTANSNQMLLEMMGLHCRAAPSSIPARRCAPPTRSARMAA